MKEWLRKFCLADLMSYYESIQYHWKIYGNGKVLVNITIYRRTDDSCVKLVCDVGVERDLKIIGDGMLSIFFTFFSPVFMFVNKMWIKKKKSTDQSHSLAQVFWAYGQWTQVNFLFMSIKWNVNNDGCSVQPIQIEDGLSV